MNSFGPPHMDEQRQDVQLEPAYSNSVPTRDIALRLYRKQWTIGRCGERGPEISVLIAWHDDDDDDDYRISLLVLSFYESYYFISSVIFLSSSSYQYISLSEFSFPSKYRFILLVLKTCCTQSFKAIWKLETANFKISNVHAERSKYSFTFSCKYKRKKNGISYYKINRESVSSGVSNQ